MRLKTLDIKGFKSFADKTVIHFNDNMTGIVGPNGCGKSNTVDAIRWVLGEQKSRALRLEKMDNVIFNGTKQRKQSGKAEVALTFENTRNLLPTEFSTVTVSRVLYRTGDSEYKLNGVKCRLKDITNLFMDTGISSDSYAIIELKMIDEILNDKDNSRRKLFEQAAGISKYKKRKRQTLLKLNATEADLSRVEDLLFEIEDNLKKLERQAKRAERYYRIKDEYKAYSIALAKINIAGYRDTFAQLEKQKQEESDKKLALETKITTLEAEVEERKKRVLDKEQNLAAFQKKLNEHIAQLQSKENEKNLLAQNSEFLGEKQETLKRQLVSGEEMAENFRMEIEKLIQDKNNEENRLEELTEKLEVLRTEADTFRARQQDANSKLEGAQEAFRNLEKEIFEQEKIIAIKHSQKDSLIHEIKDSQLKFQSRQTELEDLKENLEKTKINYKDASEKLAVFHKEEKDLKEAVQETQEYIETNGQKLIELNRELDAQRNEYKLTKSLVDSLEGFPDSIKYLKKNNNQWNQTAAPLLLDIVNCEEEYKIAIENYLKPFLNDYVVKNVDEAIEAINLLNASGKGKANFFVLEDLKTERHPVNIQHDFAVSAIDIIKVKEEFMPLVLHLLHEVYIVEDGFMPSNGLLEGEATFLTKSGKFIRKKATIAGGSVGAYEGKRIGKKQQLQKLEKSIVKLEAKAGELGKNVEAKKAALKKLQQELNNKANWIRHQEQEVSKLNGLIMNYEFKIETSIAFIQESENKESGLNEKIGSLDEEANTLHQSLNTLFQTKNRLHKEVEKAELVFDKANENMTKANLAFNEMNIEYHKQQNRLQQIQQNLDFKTHQLENTEQQFSQNTVGLKETENRLQQIKQQLENAETNLISFYEDKEVLEVELRELENEYYKARAYVEEVDKVLREKSKSKEQTDYLLNQINEQFNQIKMNLVSLKERLNIEFKVDIDDLFKDDNEAGNDEEVEEGNEDIKDDANKEGETGEGEERGEAISGEESKGETDGGLETTQNTEKAETDKTTEVIITNKKAAGSKKKNDKKLQDLHKLSKEELEENVNKLKGRLERYGQINPMAMEAYQEIKERFDFISTQRNDLLEAKQSLVDTISEIEDKATGQFMEAFDKVRENFVYVFRSLFTEQDTCDLTLVDENDPLESEIDIIAKPKGKRPQSINQLSGGEKSLTALALVFSLYLLKPAPFCILDEVDAPLDDANVSKFTNIIRQFSEKSQFIIVTHNKNTMSAVDVIYGVTMQEEGVSKVVPVDFRSLNETYTGEQSSIKSEPVLN